MGEVSEDNSHKNDETQSPKDKEKAKRKRKRKRKRKSEKEAGQNAEGDPDATGEKDSEPLVGYEKERATQVDRTVFVEGIPFAVTPEDVRAFFRDNGVSDIEDCRLPVWQDSGRLRGYGHVVFETAESQEKAIGLSGQYLQNRYLTITKARKPKESFGAATHLSEPSCTVLFQNLSYEATEDDILSVVAKFGSVVDGGVRVVRHSANDRRSKGYCYVEFEDLNSAKTVVQQRISILGRPCRMDFDHGRMKGSFRAADGRFWQKQYGNGGAKRMRST